MNYLSPLRYPGGKARPRPYFARLLASQSIDIETYCEPYAGGAGAGLFLLTEGHVDRLLINDLNPGVAAFWRACLTQSDAFIRPARQCRVDLDKWHTQRAIYTTPAGRDDLELGFATYFLNRTNRSGILSARPIGGLEQTGRWKIDARFNKPDLIARINALAATPTRSTSGSNQQLTSFLRLTVDGARSFSTSTRPTSRRGMSCT